MQIPAQYQDFTKKPVFVGDEVAFNEKHYKAFARGKVARITEKMVFITQANGPETKRRHSQTIKVG